MRSFLINYHPLTFFCSEQLIWNETSYNYHYLYVVLCPLKSHTVSKCIEKCKRVFVSLDKKLLLGCLSPNLDDLFSLGFFLSLLI